MSFSSWFHCTFYYLTVVSSKLSFVFPSYVHLQTSWFHLKKLAILWASVKSVGPRQARQQCLCCLLHGTQIRLARFLICFLMIITPILHSCLIVNVFAPNMIIWVYGAFNNPFNLCLSEHISYFWTQHVHFFFLTYNQQCTFTLFSVSFMMYI